MDEVTNLPQPCPVCGCIPINEGDPCHRCAARAKAGRTTLPDEAEAAADQEVTHESDPQ